ncbi:hypothetical protein [Streptomyces sp. NPDC058092]|uniref:hypothetical protein n=1 Tax=Streptomyces sp. NPDC058092 TaxID=3346336 RepID=UPI0036EFD906
MKNTKNKQRALRQRIREQRATRRAIKAVATSTPQTARTHLVAAGIDDATANRFAPAFSRNVTPTATRRTTIKLRGRHTRLVDVKLYDQATFAARLITYRPTNAAAAARFGRAAHQLAA